MTSLITCFLLIGLMTHVRSSPPITTINLPLLEEKTAGSEVHDFMEETSPDERSEVSFKLLNQYMTLGDDEIDDDTEWVTLSERTGVMSVSHPVDREEHCNIDQSKPCVVHVKVVRQPQRYLRLFDIDLNVIDINDHAPSFPVSPIVSVNVSERAPVNYRVSLDKYLATDSDAGTNSEIYYSLSRSDYFSIHQFTNPNTGDPQLQLVVTNDLDREQTSTYDLTLTATDRGSPERRSSTVTLLVHIIDANDNAPVFDRKVYHIVEEENAEPGKVLATVHANDDDDNIFGEIRYFIPAAGNSQLVEELVEVDPISGEVTLKRPLDREKHNNLRVVIAARDLAPENQQKVGKTILAIEVEDLNDNAPTIHINVIVESNGSAAFVSESSKIGTYIAQVTADDPDDGVNSDVELHISSKPLGGAVQDHNFDNSAKKEPYLALEEGGFIKTTSHVDRESLLGFLINIRACDGGVPPLCSFRNLTVFLLDENDNSPVFASPPKSIVLGEDTDLGTVVTQVKAFDQDSTRGPSLALTKGGTIGKSLNGEIRYSLRGGGKCFVIDDVTGKIRLVRRLDYEAIKMWRMTATAWDSGFPRNSANLSVIVNVSDVNDNVPVFTTPQEFNSTVAATIRSRDAILKINAVDADEGRFSTITYSIVQEDRGGGPPRLFILDKYNGNLRLNMSNPDLPGVVGSHFLKIKAKDSGNPPLYDVTVLHVRVFDVPQAVLPTFTRVTVTLATEDKDLTLVLIVSVVSSALLLLVILLVVFIACKRKKQDTQSYQCKSAATRYASTKNSSLSQGDALTRSGPQSLMSSSQLSFNSSVWNKNKENSSDVIAVSYRNRPTSRLSQKKTSSLSWSGTSALIDRDSGRGDSDHETGSCDERESSFLAHPPENPQPYIVQSFRQDGNLGPMCSDVCTQYGHSDSCWMPTTEYNELYTGSNPILGTQYERLEARNVAPYVAGGLETISETQPLHSVLDPEHPGQFPTCYNSNTNTDEVGAYQTQSISPYYSQLPQGGVTISPYFYTEQNEWGNPQYSVSEMFHDGYAAFDPSRSPPSSNHLLPSHSSSNTFPTNNEMLQSCFLAASQGSQPLEEATSVAPRHQTPPETHHYEEVSMEETLQIVDNIERLIDH